MIDVSVAPDAIRRLVSWVLAQDHETALEQAAGRHNQHAVFVAGPLRLEVTVDRGTWSIALGTHTTADTYHPDEWEALMDGFPLAGELSDLDHQVDFIMRRWAEAVALTDARPDAEEQLRAIGTDYVRRRFGEPVD